jgi:hypothetical protein
MKAVDARSTINGSSIPSNMSMGCGTICNIKEDTLSQWKETKGNDAYRTIWQGGGYTPGVTYVIIDKGYELIGGCSEWLWLKLI